MNNPNTRARLSGIHVFGLNIQELERKCERKHKSSLLKSFNKLGNSMKTKRAYAFSECLVCLPTAIWTASPHRKPSSSVWRYSAPVIQGTGTAKLVPHFHAFGTNALCCTSSGRKKTEQSEKRCPSSCHKHPPSPIKLAKLA